MARIGRAGKVVPEIVGLTPAVAVEVLREQGFALRWREEGASFSWTTEMRKNRINALAKSGVIVKVLSRG
jgi:hypothetical protein